MKYETKCLNQILSVFACSDPPVEKKMYQFYQQCNICRTKNEKQNQTIHQSISIQNMISFENKTP